MQTVFFFMLIAAPSVLAADPNQVDQGKLQGTWEAQTFEVEGKALAWEKDLYVFSGTMVTIKEESGSRAGSYKLNASSNPRQIDLILPKVTLPFIYEIKGNTLKLALPKGRKRATSFNSKEFAVLTLTRK